MSSKVLMVIKTLYNSMNFIERQNFLVIDKTMSIDL